MNGKRAKQIRRFAEKNKLLVWQYRRLKKDIKAAAGWLRTISQNVAIFPSKRKTGESLANFKLRRKATNKRKRLKKQLWRYRTIG